ncbi:hypothetical protein [Clostridium tertium]|uniref:hypothetical protein n=1 Tax=Clostridium tertium TaxID=1559 RepID=UPI001FD7A2D0|nr:hypothetical protein [Clostridium tertium]MBP1869859.1 ribosomal protein S18 acetylase RimI-like enzyme [Clostridium tertium]
MALVIENLTKISFLELIIEKAQTEKGHDNTLEVQRIYVLQGYKRKNIGKMLM